MQASTFNNIPSPFGRPVATESETTVIRLDDEQYIKSTISENSEKGFELLFKRYHTVLCNHATRYVWSKDIAQDIVSDVFFNLWKNQEFLSINTTYRAYLFGAVRNGCHNYLTRELSRKASLDEIENFDSKLLRPDQIVHFDELQTKIESIIAALPPQCKRVFLLNRLEGKKYSEIATELDLSIKTVEMHISKALSVLRTALKDEWLMLSVLFLTSL